jgi:hypothetical protein
MASIYYEIKIEEKLYLLSVPDVNSRWLALCYRKIFMNTIWIQCPGICYSPQENLKPKTTGLYSDQVQVLRKNICDFLDQLVSEYTAVYKRENHLD